MSSSSSTGAGMSFVAISGARVHQCLVNWQGGCGRKLRNPEPSGSSAFPGRRRKAPTERRSPKAEHGRGARGFRFREVASGAKNRTVRVMPLTADQIVEETVQWPVDAVAELLDRIALAKHGGMSGARAEAWADVAERRSAELDSGKVQLVPGDEVSARIRKIVGR